MLLMWCLPSSLERDEMRNGAIAPEETVAMIALVMMLEV